MALKDRILKVTFTMPDGSVTVLDQSLQLRIKINKAALTLQNRASIDVTGLTTQLRESLLSQFTLWNKRLIDTGNLTRPVWVDVKIEAGYVIDGVDQSSVVFIGQVASTEITSPPPDISVRISCYSRQVDKTSFITSPAPSNISFANYVAWAAKQMDLGTNFICDTSYNDVILTNPARSALTRSALLIDIQSQYRPNVAAFIDDNFLIVKDIDKIINPKVVPLVDELIGIPSWNAWGIEFTTFMNGAIKLANGVQVKSKMNPSLNGQYVLMQLEYDLCSRDKPFYVKGGASLPA